MNSIVSLNRLVAGVLARWPLIVAGRVLLAMGATLLVSACKHH